MMSGEQDEKPGDRLITRADEERVRSVLAAAWGVPEASVALEWGAESEQPLRCAGFVVGFSARFWLTPEEQERRNRAGIIPGIAPLGKTIFHGWRWAIERNDLFRSLPSGLVSRANAFDPCVHGGGKWCMVAEDKEAEEKWGWVSVAELMDPAMWERVERNHVTPCPFPAWLQAAVLAALPPDGTPMGIDRIMATVDLTRDPHTIPSVRMYRAILDALGKAGEIEPACAGEVWRRWGVPEGWRWTQGTGYKVLARDGGLRPRDFIAVVVDDGRWRVIRDGADLLANQIASPPTIGAAERAALRACWERDLFGLNQKAVPVSAPSAQEMPHGYGWQRIVSSRWYLAPLAASDPEREAVAEISADDGIGGISGLLWCVKGGPWKACESVEEGRERALGGALAAGLIEPKVSPAASDDYRLLRERLSRLLLKGPRKATDLLLDALACGAPESFALPELRAHLIAIGARMVDGAGEKWGLGDPAETSGSSSPLDAAVLALTCELLGDGGRTREALRSFADAVIAEARAPIPHAVVHANLARRACAEDPVFLFDVYQAAVVARDAHREACESSAEAELGKLFALLDKKDASEEKKAAVSK